MGSFNISELRAVSRGKAAILGESSDSTTIVLTEQYFQDMCLNEMYQGKESVKTIEELMTKIEKMIRKNKFVDVNATPEGKALDAELCKVFGFRSAHLMWIKDPTMMNFTGPCTLPGSKVIIPVNEHLKQGNFRNGFYDNKHIMDVIVLMPTAIVSTCDLTGPEMTAVLLHELGHNFDYTPFAITYSYICVIMDIINLIVNFGPRLAVDTAADMAVYHSSAARRIWMEWKNLPDTIGKILPPLGIVLYGVGAARAACMKLLNYLLIPAVVTVAIPTYLFRMPFSWLSNFFTRKSETYADSMAAAYGYGAEQISALEKFNTHFSTFSKAPAGILAIPDNIILAYNEILTLALGGHGTHQQRLLRMIDSLKYDLKDPNIDAKTRKQVTGEIARLEEMYNKIVYLNDDDRRLLTKVVRQIVDQWYAGTTYDVMNIVAPEQTYAK